MGTKTASICLINNIFQPATVIRIQMKNCQQTSFTQNKRSNDTFDE